MLVTPTSVLEGTFRTTPRIGVKLRVVPSELASTSATTRLNGSGWPRTAAFRPLVRWHGSFQASFDFVRAVRIRSLLEPVRSTSLPVFQGKVGVPLLHSSRQAHCVG